MRVLIDSSLPSDVSEMLTTFGYDVADARALGLDDAPVARTFAEATASERTLLTARWEGAEPPELLGSRSGGLVIFRYPEAMPPAETASNVLEFMQAYCQEDWRERSAVIGLETLQIHPPIPRSDDVDGPIILG